MLALTRKKGEAIIIDGGIEIRIVDIQGDKVKLGITAPKSTHIMREEVYENIKNSNTEATNMPQSGIAALKNAFIKKKK